MRTRTRTRRVRYVNYTDPLSCALALSWRRTPRHQLFTGNAIHWHTAVFKMMEQGFADRVPELQTLKGTFDRRAGYSPFSKSVEDWMHVMAQGGLLGMLDLREYIMSQRQRGAILRLNREYLSRHRREIEEMAEIFREHLAISR